MLRFLAVMLMLLPAVSRADEFIVGINGSLRDGAGAIGAAASLGVTSLRIDVLWKEVEKRPGVFEIPSWVEKSVLQAKAVGLQPLLILGYGNDLYGIDKPTTSDQIEAFNRYVQFVVGHFKGRVTLYELWNEWNTTTGHTRAGTPENYIKLQTRLCPAIKAADPKATVLAGSSSGKGLRDGWMEKFFALGGHQLCSGVSIHPYNWYDGGALASPEASIRLVDKMETLGRRANAGADVPLYITEMGWPTQRGNKGISTDDAQEFLVRFCLLAASRSYVQGIWWYSLRDLGKDSADPEQNFGVLDMGLKDKPAAHAMRQLTRILQRKRIEQLVNASGDDDYSVVLAWPGGNERTRVSWREKERAPQENRRGLALFLDHLPAAPSSLQINR